MVNELHEAMSFSLTQEIEHIRKIAVGFEHTVHISQLYNNPIPFHYLTFANTVSIKLQGGDEVQKEANVDDECPS
jgi:hypothetical protein